MAMALVFTSSFPLAARGNGCIALPSAARSRKQDSARRILFRSPRREIRLTPLVSRSELAKTLSKRSAEPPQSRRESPHSALSPTRSLRQKQTEWRNEKHPAQSCMTLSQYAKPLRPRPVNEIDFRR